MQVRIEDVSPVEKKMFVEIPWETVSQKLGDHYRELGKGVALKGFRKGKVPRPVLEQVYGPRVQAEVAYELVRESFFRANQEHNLAAVAEPRVQEAAPIKKGQPFTFAAIIEVRGEVTPVDYTELPIERRKLNIARPAVDESLRSSAASIPSCARSRAARSPRPATSSGCRSPARSASTRSTSRSSRSISMTKSASRCPACARRCSAFRSIPRTRRSSSIPDDYKDETFRGRKADSDGHRPRGALEGRARSSTTSSRRTPARPTRSTALKARCARSSRTKSRDDRSRGARGCAARGDQEEPDPGRRLARRALGRAPVSAPAPDARHEARAATTRPPGSTDDLREKMRPAGADEVRGQLFLEAIADKEGLTVSDEELDQAHRGDREGPQHGAGEAARRVAARRPSRQRHVLAAPGQGA